MPSAHSAYRPTAKRNRDAIVGVGAGDDLFGGDESERAQAAAEVVSFAGPYAYDGIAVSVTVEYSVFPNWIGGTQVREVEISGDTLILRTEGAHLFAGARRQAEARLIRA